MSAAAGPVFAASLLLAFAGAMKLRRPQATVQAMRSAGLPASMATGRAVGVVELVAAAWCLAGGSGPACALVALAYLAFAAFSARLMARAGGASCGCFGATDTPASGVHVGINLVLGLAAAVAAVDPPGGLRHVLDSQPWGGVPLLAVIVLGAWASYLTLTLLPELGRAMAPAGDVAS